MAVTGGIGGGGGAKRMTSGGGEIEGGKRRLEEGANCCPQTPQTPQPNNFDPETFSTQSTIFASDERDEWRQRNLRSHAQWSVTGGGSTGGDSVNSADLMG